LSTVRRTPPAPAPSRVAGTLKVRARQPEASDPAAATPEAVTSKQEMVPARKPAASAPRDEDRTQAERGKTGAPRGKEERGSARPTAKVPARRKDQPAQHSAAEASCRSKPGRPADQRPARPKVEQRGVSDRPARTTARPQAPQRSAVAPSAAAVQEGVRLSKVMAERGLCSRREADGLIERGWVFVDGRRITELGSRIDPGASITLAPEARRQQAQRVTILLHKPVGYVSGQPEPGYEPAVVLISAENQFDRGAAQNFHPSQLKGLAPAGRLDIDSTGLLVLTQDGRVARQLIGEDSKTDKEYLVRVEGELSERGLALLNHGLELDGRKLRPAQVEWANADQLRFVLREGRKRQIRRMCELVGLKVVGLKRVRIGKVRLGDLPPGKWRYLREDESF
jgi:23S rRNA pseudouridine2604 synthase